MKTTKDTGAAKAWAKAVGMVQAAEGRKKNKQPSGPDTKIADDKGRITLGGEFANATLLMVRAEGGIIILRRAVTVPVEDEWLFRNKAAFAAVKRGLGQARAGEFVKGPEIPPLEGEEGLADLSTAKGD